MIDFGKLLEKKYEREIGEPWSVLEANVKERHKDLFASWDEIDELEKQLDTPPKKPWWLRGHKRRGCALQE